MSSIAWIFQVSASGESMYDDAYTLQMVEKLDVMNFNFVAGMVPFLFNLIQDVSHCVIDYLSSTLKYYANLNLSNSFLIIFSLVSFFLNDKVRFCIVTTRQFTFKHMVFVEIAIVCSTIATLSTSYLLRINLLWVPGDLICRCLILISITVSGWGLFDCEENTWHNCGRYCAFKDVKKHDLTMRYMY